MVEGKYSKTRKLTCKLYWNVKLRKISSDKKTSDFELDIVLEINNHYYIFEVKTGAVNVLTCNKKAEVFEQPSHLDRFIVCGMKENIPPGFSRSCRCLCIENFEAELQKLLDKDFPPEKP